MRSPRAFRGRLQGLVKAGLPALNYTYFVVDEPCFVGRAADGTLLENKTTWPNGLKVTSPLDIPNTPNLAFGRAWLLRARARALYPPGFAHAVKPRRMPMPVATARHRSPCDR